MVKCADYLGEEVIGYSVPDFIKATRPDGLGHIYFDGKEIAAFEEVLCDSCNKHLVQPEDEPEKTMLFVWHDSAWCLDCFKKYVLCHLGKPGIGWNQGIEPKGEAAQPGEDLRENVKGGKRTQ